MWYIHDTNKTVEGILIKAVEKKFGFKIVNRGDCEKLSEVIQEQTSKSVSYNTLRRMYGFAKPVKTRKDTLNILSNYVGYRSYYHFVNATSHQISWESRLRLYELKGNKNTKALLSFLEQKSQTDEDITLPVINLIREFLLAKRIDELKIQQDATAFKAEKDFINERIASLAGAIGCIHVGANSDVEQKEKFDRVDDSVCAVRSALQEGIVSGGGLALYMATNKFNKQSNTENQKVALEILCDAIQVPLEQIIINSGKDPKQIIKLINFDDNNVGYDVKAEVIGDMYKMGVIDPLKVTKNALTNAVSVATIILSTNAIVTHARVKQ